MSKIDTICLIDDDDIFTFLMKKNLQKLALCNNVISFTNGEEAVSYLLDLANKNLTLPEIILLDINMPIMDGWDFMEAYEQIPNPAAQKATIYIASSSITNEDKQKAASYQKIAGYLSKPIEVATLLKIVEEKSV